MPGQFIRVNDFASYSITNSASTSARIPFGAAAGAILLVPTGSITGGTTSLTWFVATDGAMTPLPLRDAAGLAVTTSIAAGNSYALPDALFAAPFVIPVANQGSVAAILCVKS